MNSWMVGLAPKEPNKFVGHIHMSYLGATGTPVLDFWWRLLWLSKARVGSALFALQRQM